MKEIFCPKCGHRHHLADDAALAECARCGIIFAKYRQYLAERAPGKASPSVQAEPETPRWQDTLLERLFGQPEQVSASQHHGEIAIWLGLLLWGSYFIFSHWQSNLAGQSFLHRVNLPFHEFGHVLFRPFGEWLQFLGGSLFQCLLPLLLMGVFLIREQQRFAATVCLWWAGQNLIDVAPYIGDAREMALSLVGEYSEEIAEMREFRHDWHNILGGIGWLAWDQRLASLAHWSGALIMLIALGWGGWCLLQYHRSLQAEST